MKILIADDTPISLELIATLLDRFGFENYVKAVNGAEALGLFDESVDLLITDREMPKMDGLALTRAIRSRENGGDVPIIMVSGRCDDEDIKEALEAGVSSFLPKPFELKDFKREVLGALGLSDI